MSIVSDLRAFLVADATLNGLVGQRVHSDEVPDESWLPAIVYSKIGTVPENRLGGPSTLHRQRWQFGARAKTRLQAEELADAIVARLEHHTGPTGSGTVGRIVLIGRFDGWDPQLESYADDVDVAVWITP